MATDLETLVAANIMVAEALAVHRYHQMRLVSLSCNNALGARQRSDAASPGMPGPYIIRF